MCIVENNDSKSTHAMAFSLTTSYALVPLDGILPYYTAKFHMPPAIHQLFFHLDDESKTKKLESDAMIILIFGRFIKLY